MSLRPQPGKDFYQDILAKAAWLLVGLWAGLAIFLPWQWSILMDEVSFLEDLRRASFSETVRSQFRAYWFSGRFYPVKMLMNVLEWRWLPLRPVFFHRIHFLIALLTLALAWLAMLQRKRGSFPQLSGKYLIFFLASAVLAKPILDMVQFLSIGEIWAAFFLSLGMFFFARGLPAAARLVWILAAWSKEPMAGIFACSAAYQLLSWGGNESTRLKKIYWLFVDLFLFAALAALASHAMKQGDYLADYSLFTLAGMRSWVYSLLRLSFFLSPVILLALIGLIKEPAVLLRIMADPWERAWNAFLLSFTLGYLFLVSPKGASGYLQIPVALTALMLIFPFAVKGIEELKRTSYLVMIFLTVFWFGMGLYSLQRWSSYAHGINEVSLVFPELVRVPHSRLVIVHGAEAGDILRKFTIQEDWSQVKVAAAEAFDTSAFVDFEGEVILLDPIRYFDPLPAELVDRIGNWAGGWRQVSIHSPSYRAYFGFRRAKSAQ